MRVRVVMFAGLAELLDCREEELELPGDACARDVYLHYRARAPEIGELGQGLLLAVNSEFCDPATPLREDDEVALLPPMSGGAPTERPATAIVTGLRRGPLPPPPAWDDGAHGAVVVFEGVVRNHTPSAPGRRVVGLEYEAYEAMAEQRLAVLAAEAAARWELTHIHLWHRLGYLEVGEASVRVAVAGAHRAPCFDACRFLIDTLKRSVPIWKRERFSDGSSWAEGAFPAPRA